MKYRARVRKRPARPRADRSPDLGGLVLPLCGLVLGLLLALVAVQSPREASQNGYDAGPPARTPLDGIAVATLSRDLLAGTGYGPEGYAMPDPDLLGSRADLPSLLAAATLASRPPVPMRGDETTTAAGVRAWVSSRDEVSLSEGVARSLGTTPSYGEQLDGVPVPPSEVASASEAAVALLAPLLHLEAGEDAVEATPSVLPGDRLRVDWHQVEPAWAIPGEEPLDGEVPVSGDASGSVTYRLEPVVAGWMVTGVESGGPEAVAAFLPLVGHYRQEAASLQGE